MSALPLHVPVLCDNDGGTCVTDSISSSVSSSDAVEYRGNEKERGHIITNNVDFCSSLVDP
jgi:hypothetical protein